MSRSVELLKKRYLKNIKENPDLFIGIELEFPIVNLEGKATDGEVVKDLFRYLPSVLGFTIEKVDDFGNPIQLLDPVSQDTILFEVAYTTIEFAFGKAESIQEVEERFDFYMATIQNKLGEANHAIVGCGIHPNWDKNENCPVAYPRYQMLMDYRTFASAAFHLGLLVHLDKLESYLEATPFFKVFGRNYKFLRRQFSKKKLTAAEEAAIVDFSRDLLQLAEEGLKMRNKHEMTYLQPLKKELGL